MAQAANLGDMKYSGDKENTVGSGVLHQAAKTNNSLISRGNVAFAFKILGISFCLALFLKLFAFDAFVIPSESMENLLLPGDFILVDKFRFGLSTPVTLPFMSSQLTYYRLITWAHPRRNDVVVFSLPDKQDMPAAFHDEFLIKRIVGLPGEKIEIVDKVVRCNGLFIQPPAKALFTDNPVSKTWIDRKIFPHGTAWNKDNYGPLLIPFAGMVLRQGDPSTAFYLSVIKQETGKDVSLTIRGELQIDGHDVQEYVFKENYYFMLGDNRDDSFDSRYWGFLPEKNIIGKPIITYFSLDEKGYPRFERMLRIPE